MYLLPNPKGADTGNPDKAPEGLVLNSSAIAGAGLIKLFILL